MRTRNVERAAMLEADDDAMDDLHPAHLERADGVELDARRRSGRRHHPARRFDERYADHAVTVVRRVVYVVTGHMPAPRAV